MADRPLRFCDVCGGLDDHPRHVTQYPPDADVRPSQEFLDSVLVGDAPVSAVEQLVSPTVRVRHLDCCASQGCETCIGTEAETQGLRGQALIDLLADLREEN